MIEKKKAIVIDLDGTICCDKKPDQSYEDVVPNKDVLECLKKYKSQGFYIIISSSRNMQSFEGNIGKINAVTLKVLLKWLDKHGIPYDEIHVGKPWCGTEGFYVDDKTIRTSEFIAKGYDEIMKLLHNEKDFSRKRGKC